jgi:putrescine transport system permease protein
MRRFSKINGLSLIAGYTFLYLPILFVVIYSFNDSKLVTTWGKFSTRWYVSLWDNEGLLKSVFTSLQIAATSASVAVVLGTFAAIAMVRFGRFKGRTLFSGMVIAPLIMPDVITGLAMLMMFVTTQQLIGWPAHRGLTTITIAHITLAMAYVYLIVYARLKDFDRSLEEAALDLGAKPAKVFMVITLPIIFPSLITGWLLAFALSLDDVVIASFLSGPGATTLPMLIFSSIRLGLSPEINALATIIVGIIATAVTIAGVILYRQQKREGL